MPLKVVHFWNQGSAGWTETFYVNATNPATWIATTASKALLEQFSTFRE